MTSLAAFLADLTRALLDAIDAKVCAWSEALSDGLED